MLAVTPKFRVGDRVKVRNLNKRGHIRTPFYIRGKAGTVEQYCGMFLNPEDLSVGNTAGPTVQLYRVLFRQPDLWADYDGPPGDTLCIEVYEHWLAPARKGPVRRAPAKRKPAMKRKGRR